MRVPTFYTTTTQEPRFKVIEEVLGILPYPPIREAVR